MIENDTKKDVFHIFNKKMIMKFFLLIFLPFLFGCSSKEEKNGLDYIKIDIYPLLGGPLSTVDIDFHNKTLIFSNLQQITTYNENCKKVYEKIERYVELTYIKLSNEELIEINKLLNKNFLESIKENNRQKDKNDSSNDIYDGILFEFDVIENNNLFSTDHLLILDQSDEIKIYGVLKIVKKHVKSDFNKKYIENISFYINHNNEQTNYKISFP